jgi:SAM-dependent methyltransferase/GNAT superfamily N-acetyltransferase
MINSDFDTLCDTINIEIIPQVTAEILCRQITACLPEYFGLPDANEYYATGVHSKQNFAAKIGNDYVGLIAIDFPYPNNCNIYWIAVLPLYHRKGIGRKLIEVACKFARESGAHTITVETLAPFEADARYLKTYNFYLACSFAPLFNLKPHGYAWNMVYMVHMLTTQSNKGNVFQTYDKIANWYDENRSRDFFEKSWIDHSISYIKPATRILDLGCGMGEPITHYLLEQGFEVVGIDGSWKLIDIAKERLPKGKFFRCDMRGLNLNQKFDLVIAWHSFFHLTQDDQRAMFATFTKHLNNDGVLLFTSGPDAGEVWSDNGGESLYHASLSPNEYKNLLKEYRFELIAHNIEDEKCGGATIWLARLPKIVKSFDSFNEYD